MSTSFPQRTSLSESARIQGSVIGALIMRELQTRFGRHNIGFLWLFLEPLVLGTAVAAIHYASGHSMPGGLDPFMFSIIGYVPFFVFRAIFNRAPTAIHANLTLLFHRHVTLLDIMIARNLLESAAVTGVILILLAFTSVIAGQAPENVSLIMFGMICMILLSHGLSLMLAAAGTVWEGFDRLVHPFTYLMMPLSGAFYALAWFPPEVREALLWIPLVNIHEMIREGQFGSRLVSYYDVSYIIEWILVTNLLGMAALRRVRRNLSMF
ncbi:ABC transporter permease [Roseomonas sp. BN140053]|uniref:ABC transporter permease n=1 Tax=Roseomonas sp. BN140053 TaxID=3391898 RepID=UPI0039ECDC37